MIKRFLYFLLLPVFACTESAPEPVIELSPERALIEKAISYHFENGTDTLDIGFSFRNRAYEVEINPHGFQYQCSFRDTSGKHLRILNNSSYSEMLDGKPLVLSAKDSLGRSGTVNSVAYFALLPLNLRDAAVQPKLLGQDTIKGKVYHQLEVTFSADGGGEDYEDVYRYWFDVEDYSMDYLAYSFLENETGTRFRRAYNSRRINGILFQDYENYKGPSPDSLEYIGELFKAGELELLSKIELSAIAVQVP